MEHLPEYLHNHPYLVGLAVLMAVIVAVFEFRARAQSYSSVLPQEAIRLMNGGAVVFDIRDAESFAAGHISGARVLTDDQVASAGESLKKYKQKNLVVYCDQGVRGAAIVRKLHAQGFTQVFNLKGGLTAWRAESLPLQRS
jgi:rhodanese-related sulfurtransferase